MCANGGRDSEVTCPAQAMTGSEPGRGQRSGACGLRWALSRGTQPTLSPRFVLRSHRLHHCYLPTPPLGKLRLGGLK